MAQPPPAGAVPHAGMAPGVQAFSHSEITPYNEATPPSTPTARLGAAPAQPKLPFQLPDWPGSSPPSFSSQLSLARHHQQPPPTPQQQPPQLGGWPAAPSPWPMEGAWSMRSGGDAAIFGSPWPATPEEAAWQSMQDQYGPQGMQQQPAPLLSAPFPYSSPSPSQSPSQSAMAVHLRTVVSELRTRVQQRRARSSTPLSGGSTGVTSPYPSEAGPLSPPPLTPAAQPSPPFALLHSHPSLESLAQHAAASRASSSSPKGTTEADSSATVIVTGGE